LRLDRSGDGRMSGVSVADAKGFMYEPVRGSKRKIEFEPRSDGGFERVEAVWNGCQCRVSRGGRDDDAANLIISRSPSPWEIYASRTCIIIGARGL
jgi:hypothetical protein